MDARIVTPEEEIIMEITMTRKEWQEIRSHYNSYNQTVAPVLTRFELMLGLMLDRDEDARD